MWSGNYWQDNRNEMVMRGLCRDGSLEVCIFSFYLTGTSGSSYIDFGTIDTSIVTDPSETAWIDIQEADEWGNRLNGFRCGPEFKDKNEYSIPDDFAFADTGCSCLLGPSKTINSIVATILNTSKSVVDVPEWGYVFDCKDEDDMPSFDLLFGGYWLRVNPKDYVVKAYDEKCILCLGIDEKRWILGDVFLRGWYSMHDLTNKRIGFHSFNTRNKPIPEKSKRELSIPLP